MSIYVDDLRELVVRPTLNVLGECSRVAENLLLGTAAQESQLGFRMQSCQHIELGIYCISPCTHVKVWDEYLVNDPELASRIRGLASQQQFLKSPHTELITNLSYATAIAWMIYKSRQLTLAENAGVYELAQYWLDCYSNRDNQRAQILASKDTEIDRFVQNFGKLVLREKKDLAA